MSKRTFFVLLNILPLAPLFPQILQPGYLITQQKDTITGKIRVVKPAPSGYEVQHFLVKKEDGSEEKWESKEVVQYSLNESFSEERASWLHHYAKVWPHDMSRVFLPPVVSGKAQLYHVPAPDWVPAPQTLHQTVYRTVPMTPDEKVFYISLARTEMAVQLSAQNYDTVLKGLLADCPDFTARIGKKKFKFRNLPDIIRHYNESCGN